jgi:nitroreductase
MDTFLAIASKRDQREYADREIPEEVVRRILEAGRIAGSASNRQPWRFIALESAEAREQVAATVYTPPNILGSKLAVAIVVQGNRGFDAGRAAQNMMLAAWNDGVTSCPNGMPDAGKAGEVLGLGEDEHVLNVISFGYPARERNPEERLVEEWLSRASNGANDCIGVSRSSRPPFCKLPDSAQGLRGRGRVPLRRGKIADHGQHLVPSDNAERGPLVETQSRIVRLDAEAQCRNSSFASLSDQFVKEGAADAAASPIFANSDCNFGGFGIHETETVRFLCERAIPGRTDWLARIPFRDESDISATPPPADIDGNLGEQEDFLAREAARSRPPHRRLVQHA